MLVDFSEMIMMVVTRKRNLQLRNNTRHQLTLHFYADVPPGPAAHPVVGNAVIGPAVVLGDVVDSELAADVDGASSGQQLVVLPTPRDAGLRVARRVAVERHLRARACDH